MGASIHSSALRNRAIPSVPSVYPGGPELLSLLLARQLGQVLQLGNLQKEQQVIGLEVRLSQDSSASSDTLVCFFTFYKN
jgi:hypothetical protein